MSAQRDADVDGRDIVGAGNGNHQVLSPDVTLTIVDLCDSVEVKRKVILQLPHIARSFHRSVRVRTLCVYEYTSRVRVSTFAAALVEYLLVCCALDGLYELVLVLRVRDLDE